MVGTGETYLPAFALAIGLGEMAAGLVSSVPLVAGGLMQLISPRAVRLLGSHRRWVVICATIQALSFLPLVAAAAIGSMSLAALMMVATIYWGAGLATGPAWNTWVGTLIPRSVRPRFFALRTRVSQFVVLLTLVGSGLLLQAGEAAGRLLLVFGILFSCAAAFRLLSSVWLRLHSEPTPLPDGMRQIPWRLVRHHLRASRGGRLLVYLVAVQAAVQLASPFFTPFMLQQLDFSYTQFVMILAAAFLAKVIALPIWGRWAKRAGAYQLLWIGGIGITPLSAGWVVSHHFGWLLFLQVVAGVVWAAYELAFFLLIFESIPEQERTSVLTIYNVLNTTAWVGGSLLGGAVLYQLDVSYYGYLVVFGLSAAGRAVALTLLARVPALAVEADEFSVRTIAIRPGGASLDAPVLPSLPDQREAP